MKDPQGWQCPLRENYKGFAEFEAYDRNYSLAKRLGYKSARAAWNANPMIQGSTDPADFKLARVPAMPRVKPRRLYDGSFGLPYWESDRDYLFNNLDACLWVLDYASEIRRLLAAGRKKT